MASDKIQVMNSNSTSGVQDPRLFVLENRMMDHNKAEETFSSFRLINLKMETGRADEWKNNLDAHAFLNTFINCAASDNREYFSDVIQTYNDVLNDGKLLCNVTETMKVFFNFSIL